MKHNTTATPAATELKKYSVYFNARLHDSLGTLDDTFKRFYVNVLATGEDQIERILQRKYYVVSVEHPHEEKIYGIIDMTDEELILNGYRKHKVITEEDFTRAKRLDVNGNPRYITHFLNFLSQKEIDRHYKVYGFNALHAMYVTACTRANKVGGRKFSCKEYGGGIIFQMYNCTDEIEYINNFLIKEGV